MPEPRSVLDALRSFARTRQPSERCDVCGETVGARHEHLLEPGRRDIRCACAGCALVVSGREGSAWRRVPDRAERLALELSDEDWASLGLPIEVAFLVKNGATGRVAAHYPSPAGAVESSLPLDSWSALVAKNAPLGAIAPDVEALLVNRRGGAREHWRVSIDRCFRLVAVLRRSWRGFTGGPVVTAELARFFARLEEDSRA